MIYSRMKKLQLLLFTCMFACSLIGFSQEEMNLWPAEIPFNKEVEGVHEEIRNKGKIDEMVSNITIPTLTIYQPENWERVASECVIICPGGAYVIEAMNLEGREIAKYFAENGITALLLKYRLPSDEYQTNKTIVPLSDAQQAIRVAREKAEELNIIKNKIGIMGFSAGGNLASVTSTRSFEQTENGQLLPDFSLLIYPVISMKPEITHKGSHDRLLGAENLKVKEIEFSAELQINEHTPPAFMVHAFDDRTVHIENSIRYMERLQEFNIPCEMHFYKKGGHGFGMKEGYTDSWPNLMLRWIKDL